MRVKAGDVIEVPYPFVRERVEALWDRESDDTEIPYIDSWRPGIDEDFGDREADAMGVMLLTVVSVHVLPGRYKPRVFYTRQWRDPDGRTFGKGQLRIRGLASFTALTLKRERTVRRRAT